MREWTLRRNSTVLDEEGDYYTRSIPGRILDIILSLGGLAANAYLLSYAVCWDCEPILAQANNIAHWITFAGTLLFFASMIVRSPRLVWAWLAPSLLAFTIWYGPNLIPRPAPNVSGIQITAATYNVAEDEGDIQQKFDVIAALDTDLIAINEIGPALKDMVSTRLRDKYPYQYEFPSNFYRYTEFALISRYPLTEDPEDMEEYRQNTDSILIKRFIHATVEVEDQTISVYVFHPIRPPFELGRVYDDSRLKVSLQHLISEIVNDQNPVLVLCDCNFTPRSRQYTQMNALLDEAFGKRGWGLGLTSPGIHSLSFPNVRVDYIWYSREFTALDASVGETAGTSDHLPLQATLVLSS